VRNKLIFLLITLGLVLPGCKSMPSPINTPAVSPPAVRGLVLPKVSSGVRDAIRQDMALFLNANPYTEFEVGAQLIFYLVSSGEFGQAEITLENGETVLADVLYTYALMSNQRVLAVPVTIGMLQPDGQYAYFSEKFAFDHDEGVISTSIDRETALEDARQRLPRERIFRLIAYGMVSPQELLWNQCRSKSFMPEDVCQAGEIVEQLHPGATKLFVLRTADRFPEDWLLLGWVFQEFAVEELAPGISPDVILP